MKNILRFFSVLAFSLWVGSVNATLIDNGDTTVDPITGLTWLDLTESLGMSVQDVWDDVGGFLSAGWSVASSAQVDELFAHAGVPAPSSELNLYKDSAITDYMLGLFGITGYLAVDEPFGVGLADNGGNRATVPYYMTRQIEESRTAGSSECCVLYTDASDEAGVWLIMPAKVPVPSSIALVALGLLGLVRKGLLPFFRKMTSS
jgi:hypothetical protein